MKFNKPGADVFIPDEVTLDEALDRVTHLGVAAHPDDLELMALHGILHCLEHPGDWFGAVVCTGGGRAPERGRYEGASPERLREIRRREQNLAALIGRYAVVIHLDYQSVELTSGRGLDKLADDLAGIVRSAHPSVVYTHNPADRHDTHVAVCAAVVRGLRRLPHPERPRTLYGCELWRSLDWLVSMDRVALPLEGPENIMRALAAVHDSQISGGRRYDLAVEGRALANAALDDPHRLPEHTRTWLAMDLTGLLHNDELELTDYVATLLDNFRRDVLSRLQRG
ncbi:MAG TPA: PIG-L family deacetylase [Lentisphaerae bacterium]|nr:PIG-L family deacetylase [Lentisphaerota bacterium]